MAKSKKPGALFVVLALVAGTWWWFVGHESGRVAVEHGLCGSNGPSVKTASSDPSGVQPAILTAANELVSAKTGEERLAALAGLRAALASGLTNEVSAAIRRFLDSKLDAATGLGFKIGQGGFLMHAPTLRTWLLDYLAQIDPAAAAEYAKVILNSSDSSDEWAVALRSLAVGDNSAEARDLLETKMSELLQNQAWQQNPSTGYLEAFDTAVYLGGADLLPPLANLVQGRTTKPWPTPRSWRWTGWLSTIRWTRSRRWRRTPDCCREGKARGRIILRARMCRMPSSARFWKIICSIRNSARRNWNNLPAFSRTRTT